MYCDLKKKSSVKNETFCMGLSDNEGPRLHFLFNRSAFTASAGTTTHDDPHPDFIKTLN